MRSLKICRRRTVWHYALLGIWERFDTLWYLRIAEHGYDLPHGGDFLSSLSGGDSVGELGDALHGGGLVVSTVAAFFFFWGLLRLAAELSEVGRLRMVLLVCVWPTSFVLFAGYAESLNLALLVWAVVFGRERRWWAATACGILTGLGRPSGVLVFIPLAVMALRSRHWASVVR